MNEMILVTGASSGIGETSAICLSKRYKLILCGRDKYRLESTLKRCCGSGHLIWQYDFTHPESIESSLSEFIVNNGVTIFGLVHCAGMIKYIPVKMFSCNEFEIIYRVNVFSAAMLLKTLVSKKHNQSALRSVVFISSNISNFGAKAHALYGSSKAALDGLMRSAAIELAPKVKINSILPGGVRTSMTQSIFENADTVKKMESAYPLGLGTTEDISNVIEFLISDKNTWLTGQQIIVDGGRTINLSV